MRKKTSWIIGALCLTAALGGSYYWVCSDPIRYFNWSTWAAHAQAWLAGITPWKPGILIAVLAVTGLTWMRARRGVDPFIPPQLVVVKLVGTVLNLWSALVVFSVAMGFAEVSWMQDQWPFITAGMLLSIVEYGREAYVLFQTEGNRSATDEVAASDSTDRATAA